MFVDSLLRIPAFRLRDLILVLSREPAGERCVGGSPASVVPGCEKLVFHIGYIYGTLFIFF